MMRDFVLIEKAFVCPYIRSHSCLHQIRLSPFRLYKHTYEHFLLHHTSYVQGDHIFNIFSNIILHTWPKQMIFVTYLLWVSLTFCHKSNRNVCRTVYVGIIMIYSNLRAISNELYLKSDRPL